MKLTGIYRLTSLAALIVCAGCAQLNNEPVISQSSLNALLRDDLFAASDLIIELAPNDFLALPPEYQAELDSFVLSVEGEYDRYLRLRRWMYRRFQEFEFDVSETYSISELSTSRKINCLSFSVMFVAAARYAGIPANFQLVSAPPYWDAVNGTWINSQHINVTGVVKIENSTNPAQQEYLETDFRIYTNSAPILILHSEFDDESTARRRYTMDISPAVVSSQARRELLEDYQVLSLYYSNKAMQHLLDNELAPTYAYIREALRADSDSAVAWNNLGVVYSRLGRLELAASAFQNAMLLDGDVHSAQSNLAGVYRRMGRTEEAAELEASVVEYIAQNPYYHQRLANTAMDAGNYQQAVNHLQDAVALKHNEFLFYHQLAIAHQQLGNAELVIRNLISARRHSRGEDRARFRGKLQALRELASN